MMILAAKKPLKNMDFKCKLEDDETPKSNVDLLQLSGFEEMVPLLNQNFVRRRSNISLHGE